MSWLKPRLLPRLPDAGLFHYRIDQLTDEKSRVHLRIDQDGHGTLIVNANRILHLNPTATMMAYLLLEKVSRSDALKILGRTYRVDRARLQADLDLIQEQLNELVRPDGACPVHDLELEVLTPFSSKPAAPYRLDLALTYRCNNDCSHCYNVFHPAVGAPEVKSELNSSQWKAVLEKAWSLGIPHIIFTGGEPTLREDLPELIAYAENLGQITGLNTNARRLADKQYVEKLVRAGLDHVQITLESADEGIHDLMVGASGAYEQTVQGIQNALNTSLFVMTNTTMLRTNATTIPSTLDLLARLKVPTVGLNALIYSGRGAKVGTGLSESELAPLLEIAQAKTSANDQRLIWYTPTQYCNFDPVQMDLGIKGCTAALYNMCIEPDGAVLPCQSYYQPLGYFLQDPWESIWRHPLALRLRERQALPSKCSGCLLVAECGGGCPLLIEGQTNGAQLHETG